MNKAVGNCMLISFILRQYSIIVSFSKLSTWVLYVVILFRNSFLVFSFFYFCIGLESDLHPPFRQGYILCICVHFLVLYCI